MVHASEPIHVNPGSELDRILEDADDKPVTLERHGRLYRLSPIDRQDSTDLWADYDPKQSLERIRSAIGGWEGLVDAEELKRYIYERRRTANRPSVEL